MTPEELKTWRADHRLSHDRAAVELGKSKRMMIYYEDGTYPIPRYIELSCAAIERGIRKFTRKKERK